MGVAADVRVRQLELLQWLTSDHSEQFFKGWQEYDERERRMMNGTSGIGPKGNGGLRNRVALDMQNSTLWTLTPEMLAVVWSAHKSAPLNPLRTEDFPSRCGFLWLPADRDFQAVDGVPVPTRAISWATQAMVGRPSDGEPEGPGAVMLEWIDRATAPEEYRKYQFLGKTPHPSVEGGFASLIPGTVGTMQYGRIPWVPILLPSPFSRHKEALHDPAVRKVMSDFYKGRRSPTDPPIPEDATVLEGDERTQMYVYQTSSASRIQLQPDPAWRFLAALCWLLKDELPALEVSHAQPSKSDIRYLRRARLPLTPVSTIHWRRRTPTGGRVGTGTPLSYRYLRRDFWRQQWYPSEGRHRPKYIAPTIVGDPSLPFVDRAHVNVVSR